MYISRSFGVGLDLLEAGEIADDDTAAVADLLHLHSHLAGVRDLVQVGDDLAHRRELAHDGEHLLLHVLGESAKGAGAFLSLAVGHKVESGILEVADLDVLIDLSELTDERKHVLGDFFEIAELLDNSGNVLLGGLIEAFVGGVRRLLVEAVVVTVSEALNTLDDELGGRQLQSGDGDDGGGDNSLQHF